MGWAKLAVVLVMVTISLFVPTRVAAEDFLSPLLSPVFNRICDAVSCGKGSCHVSANHTLGFVCECDPGWSQFHISDDLRFLPCVIPNCSVNYSCSNESSAPAAPPVPSPASNASLVDPCAWSFCGGGSCLKTSAFEHRCDCNEGFGNLFNVSTFPCYRDCSLGANCTLLGITLSNSSVSPSSPNASVAGSSSSCGDYSARQNLEWFLFALISLTMIQMI